MEVMTLLKVTDNIALVSAATQIAGAKEEKVYVSCKQRVQSQFSLS